MALLCIAVVFALQSLSSHALSPPPPTPGNCSSLVNVDFTGIDLEIASADSEQLCCNECFHTTGCVAFSFHHYLFSRTNNCFLKSLVNGTKPASSISSGALRFPPPPACNLMPDLDFNYKNFASLNDVESASDCCVQCRKTAPCVAFTFASGNVCYLKAAAEGIRAYKGEVTGALGSPLRTSEILSNKTYYGYDFQNFIAPSVYSCYLACSFTATCVAFTFDSVYTRCYLKSRLGSITDAVGSITGKLGALLVNTKATFAPETNFYGYSFTTTTGSTASECSSACATTPPCVAFSLDSAASTCYLQSQIGKIRKYAGGVAGVLAPPLRQPSTLLANQTYYGHDTHSFSTTSLSTCIFACQYTEGCVAFTLDSTTDYCYIKSAVGSLTAAPGSVTGQLGPTTLALPGIHVSRVAAF